MAPPAPSLAVAEHEPGTAPTPGKGHPTIFRGYSLKQYSIITCEKGQSRKPGPRALPDGDSWEGFFCELALNFVGIYSNVIFPKMCGKNYSVSRGTSAVCAEGNQIRVYSPSSQANE